jgi:hypothetical protein
MFLYRDAETDALEDEYDEELEKTCRCNIEEDGCSCKNFYDWFECRMRNLEYNRDPEDMTAC